MATRAGAVLGGRPARVAAASADAGAGGLRLWPVDARGRRVGPVERERSCPQATGVNRCSAPPSQDKQPPSSLPQVDLARPIDALSCCWVTDSPLDVAATGMWELRSGAHHMFDKMGRQLKGVFVSLFFHKRGVSEMSSDMFGRCLRTFWFNLVNPLGDAPSYRWREAIWCRCSARPPSQLLVAMAAFRGGAPPPCPRLGLPTSCSVRCLAGMDLGDGDEDDRICTRGAISGSTVMAT